MEDSSMLQHKAEKVSNETLKRIIKPRNSRNDDCLAEANNLKED